MRLIDADATKRRVADTYFDTLIPCVNRALDDSPTIDAVPVVRCKDCRNYKWNPYSQEDKLCMCWGDWVPTEPDDFCSYGELKEGADNG